MSAELSVRLVIDASGLLAVGAREWQEFSRVGSCWVPSGVLDYVKFLCDRASEPEVEQTARAFMRFFPESDWQIATEFADHPQLDEPEEATLSQKLKLSLFVGKTSYGMAVQYPSDLVVVVSNDQPLLKKIQGIGQPNLAGTPVAPLMQWARTQQPPLALSAAVHLLSTQSSSESGAPTPSMARAARPNPTPATPPSPSKVKSYRPNALSQTISGILAVAGFAIAGLIGWRIIQPASFQTFWKQTGLPALPGDPPKPTTKKPTKGQAKPTTPTKPKPGQSSPK